MTPRESAIAELESYQSMRTRMIEALRNLCADPESSIERRAAYWTAGIPFTSETLAMDEMVLREFRKPQPATLRR